MAMINKAGIPFQAQVLAWVLRDEGAIAQVRNELTPDFWQNAIHNHLARLVYEYFDTYEGVPSAHTLQALVDDALFGKSLDVSVALEYTREIDNVCHNLLKDPAEMLYLKDNLEPLIRRRLTEMALVGGVVLSDAGEFETLSDAVTAAANFRLVKDDRRLRWSTFDRSEYIPSAKTAPVSTLWPSIDTELHGGLHPGELGLMCAPPGTGKSQCLVNLAANAMRQGKHVLFITLEMGEKDINRRLDSCLSNIPYWDLDDVEPNTTVQTKVMEWANGLEEGVSGDCDVMFFPQQSITVPQLKVTIKKMYRNVKMPDLLVVDYADLFAASTEYKNSYDNQGLVYSQLVALAGEFQIPCWSASQINREGARSRVKSMEHLAESYKKAMVANVIYTLNQDEDEHASSMLRMYSVKVRNGEKNTFHYFNTDFSRSKLIATTMETYEAAKSSPDYGQVGKNKVDMVASVGTKGFMSASAMGGLIAAKTQAQQSGGYGGNSNWKAH